MPFDVILAGALGVSILLFALAGGADFGAGVWTLFARRGERAGEQQQLIEQAIGPLWEANELWVVVSAVILWSAFAPAFAAYGTALFIPFVLAIAGILLRGAFLAFRIEAREEAPGAYRWFGEIFGGMSIITPFFLGAAAGAIASGRLRLDEYELPVDGYFQPWLGPFPIIVGLLGMVTCIYLAAIYLTVDAAGNEPLQGDFRLRGIVAGLALGVLGVAAIFATRADAPYMWEQLAPGMPASILMIVDEKRDFHPLTLAGYALVLEAVHEFPVDVGVTIYANFKNGRLQIEREFTTLGDELRMEFIEVRDEKQRMVADELDPSPCEGCEEWCAI